jgi:Na+-transporting NADH:ubiquinone oxidoreductase subunit F
LRSHISWLLETELTARRVSFWYGARSAQELYYDEYFRRLAADHPNFTFHPALSTPLPDDDWDGPVGLIHEVVLAGYLESHPDSRAVEYYLCGPPMMVRACNRMLADLGVPADHIARDEF